VYCRSEFTVAADYALMQNWQRNRGGRIDVPAEIKGYCLRVGILSCQYGSRARNGCFFVAVKSKFPFWLRQSLRSLQ